MGGNTLPSLRSYIFKKMINLSIKKIVGTNIEEKRRILDTVSLKLTRVPKNITVKSVNIDKINAEWISNKRVMQGKVILYFHGGAYVYGSTTTHKAMVARIVNASDVKALLPEYRLAPEHKYPAAIEDAEFVYQWLLQQGYDSGNIILAGDSAGGGLCIALALLLREKKEPLPAAIVCLSPWVDLTSSGESYKKKIREDPLFTPEGIRKGAQLYAGNEQLTNPFISPAIADLTGLPPLFIQVGSEELLLSDSEILAQQARIAGVNVTLTVWAGMWHVWQIIGNLLPESKKAIREIGEFVKKLFHE